MDCKRCGIPPLTGGSRCQLRVPPRSRCCSHHVGGDARPERFFPKNLPSSLTSFVSGLCYHLVVVSCPLRLTVWGSRGVCGWLGFSQSCSDVMNQRRLGFRSAKAHIADGVTANPERRAMVSRWQFCNRQGRSLPVPSLCPSSKPLAKAVDAFQIVLCWRRGRELRVDRRFVAGSCRFCCLITMRCIAR